LEVVYNVLNVAALGKNTIKVEIRVVKFVLRIVLESTVVISNLKTKKNELKAHAFKPSKWEAFQTIETNHQDERTNSFVRCLFHFD